MERRQKDYLRQFFTVERFIGKGAFGQVLVTSKSDVPNVKRFAVKCILPVIRPQRLASELRHLRDLGGKFNVVQLHTAKLHKGSLFIVMDLIDHERFSKIVSEMDNEEMAIYMKNLLIALQHVHSRNIMHRDIKPANFLYNRQQRKFLLVDFGLAAQIHRKPLEGLTGVDKFSTPKTMSPARLINFGSPIPAKRSLSNETDNSVQMLKKLRVSTNEELKEPVKLTVGAYESPVTTEDGAAFQKLNQDNHRFSTPKIPRHPRCYCFGKPKTCESCRSKPESNASKSGTPGYKAPETLLRVTNQTTAIDIWSAGVMLFCLLAGHGPLFRDVDDVTSLCEIITLFGSKVMKDVAKQLDVKLILSPDCPGHDLRAICLKVRSMKKECDPKVIIPDEAFDLLRKMLNPNPRSRISACDALQHPWLKAAEK
jgi:cell division control protein 7